MVDSGHGCRSSRLAGGWYNRPCIEQCEPEPREDSYRLRAEIREPDHLGLNSSSAASQRGYLVYLVFIIFEEEGALRSCLMGWVFFLMCRMLAPVLWHPVPTLSLSCDCSGWGAGTRREDGGVGAAPTACRGEHVENNRRLERKTTKYIEFTAFTIH